MKECEYKSDIIKNKCLKKIPEQICEFYELSKITLNDIKKLMIDNRNSIKVFETYNSIMQQLDFIEKNDNPAPSSNEININNTQSNFISKEDEKEKEITPDGLEYNIDNNIDINNNSKNKKKHNVLSKHKKNSGLLKIKGSISEKDERSFKKK